MEPTNPITYIYKTCCVKTYGNISLPFRVLRRRRRKKAESGAKQKRRAIVERGGGRNSKSIMVEEAWKYKVQTDRQIYSAKVSPPTAEYSGS